MLLEVQILRGLAALCVAMEHALHDAATLEGRLGRVFTGTGAFPWNAGVDVFFVISGLIMVHSSRPLFGAPGGGAEFLKRRIARIVPLYWAATSLYLLVAALGPGFLNRDYLEPAFVLASYLFVPAARPDGLVQPVYPLGWTLNYEMFFYLLFAAGIWFSLRAGVALVLAALATLAAAGLALGPLPQPLAFWSDPIILEFALGMALGVARAEGVRAPGSIRLLLAAAGLLGLFLAVAFPEAVRAWPRLVASGFPATLLVAAAALGPAGEGRNSPLGRAGAALGDASYALYLLHPFAIRALREAFGRTGLAGELGPVLFVPMALAFSTLAALAAHRLFERPLTRWARAGLGAGAAQAPSSADTASGPPDAGPLKPPEQASRDGRSCRRP